MSDSPRSTTLSSYAAPEEWIAVNDPLEFLETAWPASDDEELSNFEEINEIDISQPSDVIKPNDDQNYENVEFDAINLSKYDMLDDNIHINAQKAITKMALSFQTRIDNEIGKIQNLWSMERTIRSKMYNKLLTENKLLKLQLKNEQKAQNQLLKQNKILTESNELLKTKQQSLRLQSQSVKTTTKSMDTNTSTNITTNGYAGTTSTTSDKDSNNNDNNNNYNTSVVSKLFSVFRQRSTLNSGSNSSQSQTQPQSQFQYPAKSQSKSQSEIQTSKSENKSMVSHVQQVDYSEVLEVLSQIKNKIDHFMNDYHIDLNLTNTQQNKGEIRLLNQVNPQFIFDLNDEILLLFEKINDMNDHEINGENYDVKLQLSLKKSQSARVTTSTIGQNKRKRAGSASRKNRRIP